MSWHFKWPLPCIKWKWVLVPSFVCFFACTCPNYNNFSVVYQCFFLIFRHSLPYLKYLFFFFLVSIWILKGFLFLKHCLVIAPTLASKLKPFSNLPNVCITDTHHCVWPLSIQNTAFTSKGIMGGLFLNLIWVTMTQPHDFSCFK